MTKPNEIIQANQGDACGPVNPAPKRSHHKRKDIPAGAPADIIRHCEEPQATKQSNHLEQIAAPFGLAMTVLNKEGLPITAYAIRADEFDTSTWQLPHHTSHILRDGEDSVDWTLLEKATLLLSMAGDEGRRISADPELIIEAARHIAEHYRKAGKSVPIALCVLI
jgi:hypothetical protein